MVWTRKKRRGFTLVEMLVVVLIIVLIMGLLMPAIQAARENARAAQCINNQQELGKALFHYDMTKNRLPSVLSFVNPTAPTTSPKINWAISIFGELGRMDLWQQWQAGSILKQPDGSGPVIKQLICPSNSAIMPMGGLSYAVNLGVYNPSDASDFSGRLFRDRTTSPAEPDQTTSSLKSPNRTVMLSETLSAAGWYTDPNSTPPTFVTNTNIPDLAFQWPPASSTNKIIDSPPGLGSNHRGMINVTFFDGHTDKIPETTACWNDPDNQLIGTP